MPRAVLEAMVLGTPVVATGVEGVGELVRAGRSGWGVPVDDARALARALCEVAWCPSEAERRAVEGQRKYEAFYSRAHYERRWREVLAILAGVPRSGAGPFTA